MKSLALLTVSILAGLLAFAQTRKLSTIPMRRSVRLAIFTRSRIGGGIELYLTQGDEEAVAVSASELEFRDRIVTEVKDGDLAHPSG